jgi:hypothetical protein
MEQEQDGVKGLRFAHGFFCSLDDYELTLANIHVVESEDQAKSTAGSPRFVDSSVSKIKLQIHAP